MPQAALQASRQSAGGFAGGVSVHEQGIGRFSRAWGQGKKEGLTLCLQAHRHALGAIGLALWVRFDKPRFTPL